MKINEKLIPKTITNQINTNKTNIATNKTNIEKLNTYVSSETAIGTFLGKTLYRKCYSGKFTSLDFILDSSLTSHNCFIINYYGVSNTIYDNLFHIPNNFETGYRVNLVPNISGLSLQAGSYYNSDSQYYIVIEYIKV